jgi:WD40 repeat protein
MGNRPVQKQATRANAHLRWSVITLAGLILLAVAVATYIVAHKPTVRTEPPQERPPIAHELPILAQWAGEPGLPTGEEAANLEELSLKGHQGPVRMVVFSPDSRWLATISDDNTAHLWDLTAPDPAAVTSVLGGHQDWISAAAYSPNGCCLATTSWDNTARLWDLRTPDPSVAPVVLRGHGAPIGAVAFSPDNRWLVTASGDSTAHLWDVSTLLPGPARTVDTGVSASPKPGLAAPNVLHGHEGAVLAVAFSPDGHWLVTASQDSTARLWDLTNPDRATGLTSADRLAGSEGTAEPLVLGGHGFGVNAVAFSPDSRWLVTASWEGIARLWDVSALLSGPARMGDTNALAASNKAGLTAPHPTDASLLLFGHKYWISAMTFSLDSRWLVTAGVDDTARLWDLHAPDPSATHFVLRGHQDWIIAATFSPDGHWLVTASADGTARLWDLTGTDPSSAPLVLCEHRDWVNAIAVSPDSHWLATGSRDGSARVWDLRTPDPAAASLLLCDHQGAVLDLAFSPDGRWLVAGSGDSTARLWDLRLVQMPD